MRGDRVYLDHNATTPMRPAVAEAMARAMLAHGNPSSIHAEGRAARAFVEAARYKVAALVGASPRNVVFTGSGTEAANTVLTPSLRRRPSGAAPGRCLVLATEHACVAQGARFPADRVETLPVGCDGRADLGAIAGRVAALADERPGIVALLSLQTANNETGVVQPVAEAARIVREAGGYVHSDAVQAAGKIPVDIHALGVDMLTLSAHKIGGPQGVGAIVLADGDIEIGDRLVRGGGQERGWRGGTENVAGIVGFGVAAETAMTDLEDFATRTRALRDQFEDALRAIAPDVVIFGSGAARLPNTSAFAVPGLKAETLLMRFDLDGFAVSSGSACSSGKVKRSHVLTAMGVDPMVAEGAIRVSFGWNSMQDDLTRAAEAFEKTVAALSDERSRRRAA